MGAAVPFFAKIAAFLAGGSFAATVVTTVLINVALGFEVTDRDGTRWKAIR